MFMGKGRKLESVDEDLTLVGTGAAVLVFEGTTDAMQDVSKSEVMSALVVELSSKDFEGDRGFSMELLSLVCDVRLLQLVLFLTLARLWSWLTLLLALLELGIMRWIIASDIIPSISSVEVEDSSLLLLWVYELRREAFRLVVLPLLS